jgi:hypothetical protein
MKAAHTKTGNKVSVSKTPTNPNRKMNPPANVSKTPSPANRSLNAPARVKPSKH